MDQQIFFKQDQPKSLIQQPISTQTFQVIQQKNSNNNQYYYSVRIPIQLKLIQKLQYCKTTYQILSKVEIYQSFTNRGKYQTIKYNYSKQQKVLYIKLIKKYYQKLIKIKQCQLFKLIYRFNRQLQLIHLKIIQKFINIYLKNKADFLKNPQGPNKHYRFIQLISIDIISITFQVTYPYLEKKKTRFRISYFQFKNQVTQLFYQQNEMLNFFSRNQFLHKQIININVWRNAQTISFSQCLNTNPDIQFYRNPRLDFLQNQQISENFFNRLYYKFYTFYSISVLCRGSNLTGCSSFNKKALHKFLFQGTKMQRFKLTFTLQNPLSNNFKINKNTFQSDSKKGALFQFFFDVEDKHFKNQQPYEISMVFYDQDKFFSHIDKMKEIKIKKYFHQKIEQFYKPQKKSHYLKDFHTNIAQFDQVCYLKKQAKDDRILHHCINNPQKIEQKVFKNRFYKFINKFCVKVSFLFDRLYFFKNIQPQLISQNKIDINFMSIQQQYQFPGQRYIFKNSLLLIISSNYKYQNKKKQLTTFKNIFQKLIKYSEKIKIIDQRKKEKQKQNKKHQFLQNNQRQTISNHMGDQMQVMKLSRISSYQFYCKSGHAYVERAKQFFQRRQTTNISQQNIQLDQVFIKYINILLKNYPLRDIYEEVFQFVFNLVKCIYESKTDSNQIKLLNKKQIILKKIVSTIIKMIQNNPSQIMFKIKIIPEEYSDKQVNHYTSSINQKQQGLFGELTYKAQQLQCGWIEIVPFGNLIIRLFNDKIQVEKRTSYNKQITIYENPDQLNQEQLAKVFS